MRQDGTFEQGVLDYFAPLDYTATSFGLYCYTMKIVFCGQLLGTWRTNHKPDNTKHNDKPCRLVFTPNKHLAGTVLYIESFQIDPTKEHPLTAIENIIKERFPSGIPTKKAFSLTSGG